MKTADFDYHLPNDLVAAHPAERRDRARLLKLGRGDGGIEHRIFADLPAELRPGDCLVLNDSRVIPARIFGFRSTGGRAEVLLLHPEGEGRWRALTRPAKKLPAGSVVTVPGQGRGEEALIHIEEAAEGGERVVRIEAPEPLERWLDRAGHVPLPPYITAARRARGEAAEAPEDRARYQTVYAERPGSVAAPTAGLHFTPDLLAALEAAGAEIRRVTLHVGPGTFAPVKHADPSRHGMHREAFCIDRDDAEAIQAVIDDSDRRVVAVGTTVTRALETSIERHGRIAPGESSTDLLILPGHRFRAVDALITNFHLPRSTLLMLVSAFAGRDRVLAAYREAIDRRYRFYSYGDAMLII